jgi:hypothetical protein
MAFTPLVDLPLMLFATSVLVQWVAVRTGARVSERRLRLGRIARGDLAQTQNVTFTLLAVIIGFSLSMSVSRYDQRKNYEESEANAIGTEYSRLDLLPAETKAAAGDLLRKYIQLRIAFFSDQSSDELKRLDIETGQLQTELWQSVARAAGEQATPVAALAVAGANDVINSQGFTLAAWRNRLPRQVWWLMLFVAAGANFISGFGARGASSPIRWILPLSVSVAFLLIAEIDSPRSGLLRVLPENLITAAESIGASPR